MFRFEHPIILYGFAFIPVFWITQIIYERWRTRKLNEAFSPSTLLAVSPRHTRAKAWWKLSVYTLAFVSLVLALANPQIGSKTEEVKRKGVDIMVALDISNSMLAEDLYPTRIDRSKRSIQELVSYLKTDRLGIVVFAGEAFVQLPITTDYSAAKLFLNTINPGLISTQGTDIQAAIEKCVASFDPKSPTSKTIIILSDGENHESQAVEAAKKAAEQGIIVHTIGMGLVEGAPIPVYSGAQRTGFRKNKEGNTVVTKLNELVLSEISSVTGGLFIRASNSQSGMDYIFDEVSAMEKVEYGAKVYTDFEDRFQFLLLPAILLLIIELMIPNRKSPWWEKLIAS